MELHLSRTTVSGLIYRMINDKLDLYCKELEESGVMILEKQIQMMEDEEGLRASGYMKVIQSIGTTRKSVDF